MKSNQSGLKVYLLLVFLVPYLLWGIILLAQELGWFNYGESFSVILVVLAANCPAIAAFFAFRREQTDYSLKKFAKSSFDIKRKACLLWSACVIRSAIFCGTCFAGRHRD